MGQHPAGTGARRLSHASAVLDAFFAHFYARNPVTATFTGIHDYDTRLPDWSREARTAEIEELVALRMSLGSGEAELSGVAGATALAANPALLDAYLAQANCDVRVAEFESEFFRDLNPALWTGEAIFGAASLMIRDFAPVQERVAALCSRLAAVAGFLATMRATIVAPIPALWRARAERECAAALTMLSEGIPAWLMQSDVAVNITGDVIDGFSGQASLTTYSMIDADTRSRLSAACVAAASAFTESLAWLRNTAVADSTRYSCGERLFTQLLARGHFCEEAPRVLLARAALQFDAATESLAQATAKSFDGSWPAVQAALAADHPTVNDYYESFAKRWREIYDGVTEAGVLNWPTWPIQYVPIPAWARDIQPSLYWLFYRSPAPFDRYTIYDYVVTPIDDTMPRDDQKRRLTAWNHSTITLNHVVHHGGAGHHVQNWNAIHKSSSRIGTVAAVDAASRIGMFLGGTLAAPPAPLCRCALRTAFTR